MSYEPQPGTIPHRAVMWVRAMAKACPSKEPSTAEICEGLGIENVSFTAYMRPAREHGLLHTRKKPETGKILFWRVGDGKPDVTLHQRDSDPPLVQPTSVPSAADSNPRVGQVLPGVPSTAPLKPPFRAIEWEGKLLVTGMEIRDGVAIFEPHHIPLLKQHTDWWRSA